MSATSSRARSAGVALGLLLLVGSPALPARAAEARGAATQDGWWNRLQGPADGEPDGNPVRPLVPAIPKPPNVPADSIAVGATGGQVDKVAGVGIDVALADGTTLERLTLRLKESPASGANVGSDKAKVLACPATTPWGPGQNAAWRDRPTADCGLGRAEGVRADDGTWTFDLAALGRLWADPYAPLAANGVVLSVDPAATPSAQVSWLNFESGSVGVELAASPSAPAPPADSGTAVTGSVAAPPPVPAPAQPSAGNGSTAAEYPVARGGISAGSPAYPPEQPTDAFANPAGETTAQPEPETALVAAPPPRPAIQARPAVDFWERVPAPTALLIPVVVGLAVLVGVILGPVGRPSPVFRREGGLSRALARRSPGGSEV